MSAETVETPKVQLRKPTVEDISRLEECLKLDEYHSGSDPKWWGMPTGELFTFYDEDGNRLFARIEKVIRIHIQHDPDVPRGSTAKLLIAVNNWLKKGGKEAGFVEIIFESVAPALIKFASRLGFMKSEHEYKEVL